MKKIVFINYFVKKIGRREECSTAFSNRHNRYTFRPPLTDTSSSTPASASLLPNVHEFLDTHMQEMPDPIQHYLNGPSVSLPAGTTLDACHLSAAVPTDHQTGVGGPAMADMLNHLLPLNDANIHYNHAA